MKEKSKFRQVLREFFVASKEEREGTLNDRIGGLRKYVSKIKPNFVYTQTLQTSA